MILHLLILIQTVILHIKDFAAADLKCKGLEFLCFTKNSRGFQKKYKKCDETSQPTPVTLFIPQLSIYILKRG